MGEVEGFVLAITRREINRVGVQSACEFTDFQPRGDLARISFKFGDYFLADSASLGQLVQAPILRLAHSIQSLVKGLSHAHPSIRLRGTINLTLPDTPGHLAVSGAPSTISPHVTGKPRKRMAPWARAIP